MARLQETLEAERTTVQQLSTQLREKDERHSHQVERLRLREEQLRVELQQKEAQLLNQVKDSQRNVEFNTLLGELQVFFMCQIHGCMGCSSLVPQD